MADQEEQSKRTGWSPAGGLVWDNLEPAPFMVQWPDTRLQGPSDGDAENPGLVLIPTEQVKSEQVGSLSLRYVDGTPVLVVSGGTAIPAALTVVDASGAPVTVYGAASPTGGDARWLTELAGPHSPVHASTEILTPESFAQRPLR